MRTKNNPRRTASRLSRMVRAAGASVLVLSSVVGVQIATSAPAEARPGYGYLTACFDGQYGPHVLKPVGIYYYNVGTGQWTRWSTTTTGMYSNPGCVSENVPAGYSWAFRLEVHERNVCAYGWTATAWFAQSDVSYHLGRYSVRAYYC